MNRPNQNILALAAVVVGNSVGDLAQAQSFGLDVGVASEYVGKGLGKSDGEVAPFAKAEVEYGAAYANVFVSKASGSQGFDSEIITTLGWRPEAAGFAFDLGALNRELPGTRAGIDANYWEYQADASRQLGPVAARLRVNYSPDGFAATREAWWVELQAAVSVGRRTKASAAVGDRTADGGASYAAWNAGVKHKLADAFAIDLRWYDTDSHSLGDNYDGRFVAAATYSF
jgi:uncharacterized protein (TIGR02001 family)